MQFLRGPVVKMLEALGYATASQFGQRKMRQRLPKALELAKNEEMELDDPELNELLQKMIKEDEVEVVTELTEDVPQVTNFESAEGEVVDVEVEKEEIGETEEREEADDDEMPDDDDPSDGALEEIEDEVEPEGEEPLGLDGDTVVIGSEEEEEVEEIEVPDDVGDRSVISIIKFFAETNTGQLLVEKVKSLLGWETEPEGEKWSKDDYLFRDLRKDKVRLNHVTHNRPFRLTLAKRYASEMLRGKWRGRNSDTIGIGLDDSIVDGQHRLVAAVLASQKEKRFRGIEAIVVFGVDPTVADTIDIGQKRSLGDVIYRKGETGKLQKKLANVVSSAVRLVWLRAGGKSVSSAPHFPHSEALDFLSQHPKIADAVAFITELDGTGADKGRIKSKLSLAYAAGMLYLMGTSGDEENDPSDVWVKACDFWISFASGSNLAEGSPVLSAINQIAKCDSGGSFGRDRICGTLANAWNAYRDGKDLSEKDCRVMHKVNKETGKKSLKDFPRVGGLDVEVKE